MGSKCFAHCVLLVGQVLGTAGRMSILCHAMLPRLCLPVRLFLPTLLTRLWKPTWCLGILLAQVTKDKTSVKDKLSLIQNVDHFALGTAGADSWEKGERVQKGDGTKLITKWLQRVFCKNCRKRESSGSPAMLFHVMFWEHNYVTAAD